MQEKRQVNIMGRRESLVFIEPEERFDAFVQYCNALNKAGLYSQGWSWLQPLTVVIMKAELPGHPEVKPGRKILWVSGYSGDVGEVNLLIPDYVPELGEFVLKFRGPDPFLSWHVYPLSNYLDGIHLNDYSDTAFSENTYMHRYSVPSYIRTLENPLTITIEEERLAAIRAMREELLKTCRY